MRAVAWAKAAGEVDLSFNALPSKETGLTLSGALTVQPDGKILIFGSVGNHPTVSFFQRLNADGTIDASFNCAVCSSLNVGSALLQPDGKILVAGNVSGNSTASALIVRLNSDGSQDNTFVYPFTQNNFTVFSSASVRAIQPDGKILFVLTESFSGSTGHSIRRFFRFVSNGTLDTSFNSPSELNEIGSWMLDSSNRTVLLGKFGSNTRHARLEPNGSLDAALNPTLTAPGTVTAATVQPDGKVIVYGDFSRMNGVARNRLVRLNADGTTDATFDARRIRQSS